MFNLFLGCKGKRFIVSMYELKSDINSAFTLPTLVIYKNVFPRYMKVSLSLTGGITSLFTLRYGLNCVVKYRFSYFQKLNIYLGI